MWDPNSHFELMRPDEMYKRAQWFYHQFDRHEEVKEQPSEYFGYLVAGTLWEVGSQLAKFIEEHD